MCESNPTCTSQSECVRATPLVRASHSQCEGRPTRASQNRQICRVLAPQTDTYGFLAVNVTLARTSVDAVMLLLQESLIIYSLDVTHGVYLDQSFQVFPLPFTVIFAIFVLASGSLPSFLVHGVAPSIRCQQASCRAWVGEVDAKLEHGGSV